MDYEVKQYKVPSENPRVIKVIVLGVVVGKGVVGDPLRRVTRVFDLDGNFIAENDHWLNDESK